VAVTHDPAFLAECDRVVVLREGTVARVGTLEECQQDPWARMVLAGALRKQLPSMEAAG
jgi:ABC-type sulfate/molybdate transport systems ATPase subunit